MTHKFIRNILWQAYAMVYSNNFVWQNTDARETLERLVANIEDYGRFVPDDDK